MNKTDNIREAENALFREWEERYVKMYGEKSRELFCPDGLHQTGTPDKSSGAWLMRPDGNEQALWESSTLRIVYLTKDHNAQNDGEGVDVRTETGLSNVTDRVYHAFYGKYLLGLYGLMHTGENGEYATLEEARQNALCYFHQAPVVRVNMKKEAGTSSCSKAELSKFIEQDEDFIRRQLEIYNPNVLVCCDRSEYNNPIWNFFETLYDDIKAYRTGDYIYYSKKYDKVFIWWYHMSARVSYKRYYEGVKEFALFRQEHPEFFWKR